MITAIIGGTGLGRDRALEGVEGEEILTPYGPTTLYRLSWLGRDAIFLPRHGREHSIPPHRINYVANIWALKITGVRQVLATAAVGALDASLSVGDMVVVDQMVDFTHRRTSTFFDAPGMLRHVDFTEPYCGRLRGILLESGKRLGFTLRDGGTYVATEGPRYETAAEVKAYSLLGGHVVGMTGAPEAALAREAGMCYGAVCLVTNPAAGVSPSPLTHEGVEEVMERSLHRLSLLLGEALGRAQGATDCDCAGSGTLPNHLPGEGGML